MAQAWGRLPQRTGTGGGEQRGGVRTEGASAQRGKGTGQERLGDWMGKQARRAARRKPVGAGRVLGAPGGPPAQRAGFLGKQGKKFSCCPARWFD